MGDGVGEERGMVLCRLLEVPHWIGSHCPDLYHPSLVLADFELLLGELCTTCSFLSDFFGSTLYLREITVQRCHMQQQFSHACYGGLTSTAVTDCSVSILLLADIWVVLAVERYTCDFIEWLSIVHLRFCFF